MEVVFFHRKPRESGNYSIEGYFESVRKHLPEDVKYRVEISKFENNGLLRRLYNIIEAAFRQGDINHITGEVHYLSFLLRKRKTILTILDCGFMNTKSKVKKLYFKFFWLYLPIKRSRVVTVISKATKEEILKYVKCDPVKIKVVYVAISPKFQPNNYFFNSDKLTLLQVGTTPNKNIPRLIEALIGINCRLKIIGRLGVEEKEALIKYHIEFNNKYNLTEDELVQEYQESDIVTFVSTYEGFGMPIVEANAVEKPVITSNLSSMPEVAGNSACIVDPFNIDDIRAGLLKIINDQKYKNDLIEKGKVNKKRFEISQIVNEYINIYNNISHC